MIAKRPSALVIGAGVGGIATAAGLARAGFRVEVLEKLEGPGGRVGRLEQDGHRVDSGPTIYLMPEVYAQAFAALGARIEDHLDLRRVDPTYRLHFADGSKLSLTSELVEMRSQLEEIEAGSFGAFLEYLDQGRLHYEQSMRHLVQRNFRTFLEFATLKNLLLVFRLKALLKHFRYTGRFFSHPHLRAAFSFQDMYMGLSPYQAPALYSLLQYSEFADGIWYPVGGMYRIVEALTEIASELGVRFRYNMPVERIQVDGSVATGVRLADGQTLSADLLVANADLGYVYRSLLPESRTAARLRRKRYGCSALIFTWGLRKRYPKLGAHNLFLASDYRGSFDPIFDQLTLPDDPSFYVHAPSRIDPAAAPPDGDTLMVAFPIGHLNPDHPQDWSALQDQARKIAFQRLAQIGLADLESQIKFERVISPPDWQRRFNLLYGSTHGLSHQLTQMGYLRPHNRHPRYHNLYFVGASTHPGTGVPTVLISAQLGVQRILEEFSSPRLTIPNWT